MMLESLPIAAIGAVLISVLLGPLGCMVVWRRMAYLGETVAHSTLLGVVIGISFLGNLLWGVALMGVLMAALLTYAHCDRRFSIDSVLGMIAHSALAGAMLLMAWKQQGTHDVHEAHGHDADAHQHVQVDDVHMHDLLFGNITDITSSDLVLMAVCVVAFGGLLYMFWRPLLKITLHPALAEVEGVAIHRITFVFMLTLAVAVAISIKWIGILLLVSMLIIPALIARLYATSPIRMALMAGIVAALSMLGGVYGAAAFTLPAGPLAVIVATLLFVVAYAIKRLRHAS